MTFATLFFITLAICDARETPSPDPRCVAYVSNCLISEYNKSKDPDWAFEQCAESVPSEWIRG
jgi:hypothetical protein